MVVNCLLIRIAKDISVEEIWNDSCQMVDELVRLAYLGLPYRPIGSQIFLMALNVAWSIDPSRRDGLEEILLTYHRDIAGQEADLDLEGLDFIDQKVNLKNLSSA